MKTPSVNLTKNEFLLRTSNRIVHESPGSLSHPCGFYAKIENGNGDLRQGPLPINPEMSSIAGSPEARARKKLVKDEMEYVSKRKHASYTHKFYRTGLDKLKTLEWFRKDWNSARKYLEGGLPDLLDHCEEMKRILEESLPKPAEIYDYVPDDYGIKSIYGQVYRVLKRMMLEGSSDFDSALVAARLDDELTVEIKSPGKRRALGVNEKHINLHDVYRERCEKLLKPLREILSVLKNGAKRFNE